MKDGMTPEEQLQAELIAIAGADPEKLASVRGSELDASHSVQDSFPGLQKVASLSSMPLDQIMEDPNFKAGVNYELDKMAGEWVPIARKLLGLE